MAQTNRRQVYLFLVAVVVPSLLLVSVSMRIISQERELAKKRHADERIRELEQFRQKLFITLERIRRAEGRDPAVAFVGVAEGNRLILPWERKSAAEQFRKLVSEPEYGKKIQEGEREELIDRRFDRALVHYNDSLRSARHPLQRAYAEILIARALVKAGRGAEAQPRYSKLLDSPFELVDDHGVPFALYAAERLVEMKTAKANVATRLDIALNSTATLGPAESYMLRTIANSLPAAQVSEQFKTKLAAHIGLLEQALALQNDFSNLVLAYSSGRESHDGESIWFGYGEQPWLVGAGIPITKTPTPVVIVKADEIVRGIEPRMQLSKAGEPLGEPLPGVRIVFSPSENAADSGAALQQSFYFASLALVLSITLFGAYLLWRDVRREVRMADMRSQFVSSVTHELKTPLTAIRAFAETLQLRHGTDERTRDEYLETIVNESERLTRLLNNVLDFSKIERGQKMYHMQSASLAAIVQAAGRAMQYPLAQQGFHLRITVDEDIPPIRLDRDSLEQAILNLLTNAMKYSGDSREIDLRLKQENKMAVIQVQDRGIGIEPDEHSRIFEKFYRVPTSENKLIAGTGLGLALVAHVAKAHGGDVGVESAPGSGSTFSIQLPIEAGA